MLKFSRVSDPNRIEQIINSISAYTEVSFSSSSIKKLSFESKFGKGYFSTDYSDLNLYLEEKPKFFILLLDDDLDESQYPLLMKIINMKHQFASKQDAKDFISDLGKDADYLFISEIDPNKPEELTKSTRKFLEAEIPF